MLKSSRWIAALLAVLAWSAGCRPPLLAYERICTAPPERPIDLVHVDDEAGQLWLGVYARGELLAEWPSFPPPVPPTSARLRLGERFFRSANGRVLGVRSFTRDPAPPGEVGARRTSLRFLGRPASLPTPPAPLVGAREAHVSNDRSTLLVTSSGGEGRGPMDVQVFERVGPGPGRLEILTSYQNPRPGAVQLSRRGDVVALEDGDEVRILDRNGTERRRLRGGFDFRLARRGDVLAVSEPSAVVFHPLRPGAPQRVPVSGPPLRVDIVGPRALIRTRSTLSLVEWADGRVLWDWTAPQGHLTSAALFEDPSGRIVVAVGRLETTRSTARRGGRVEWGEASAHVDVLNARGDEWVRTLTFDTSRWNDGAPEVSIVDRGRRILVRAGDSAWISETLP